MSQFIYNERYYYDGVLHSLKPKKISLRCWQCSDGTIVGFFQGKRGLFPDVDFQIKVLLPGLEQKMFTPAHWDWVVDLLIKSHVYPAEISNILNYYINFYDNRCIPFDTQLQRDNHQLQTIDVIKNLYAHVVVARTLPIDALAVLLELFCYCEKRNQPVAHQFRDALIRMKDYCDGKTNLVDVLHLVCSHF